MGQLEKNVPPQFHSALRQYLTQGGKQVPVSVSEATQAMRKEFPKLNVSDEDLATLITAEAIETGASVLFDSRTPN